MADVQDSSALNESPLVGFQFQLDLKNIQKAGFFMEVSGLGSETEVVEHKVTNDKGDVVILKIPGRLKWGDITLKRGITSNMELWKWRKQVVEGDVEGARQNGSIIMLSSDMLPVAQWDFVNAWPSKIDGPSLDVESNDVGVEEIVIVHEHIERVS